LYGYIEASGYLQRWQWMFHNVQKIVPPRKSLDSAKAYVRAYTSGGRLDKALEVRLFPSRMVALGIGDVF
jgi:hypothetical protein